MAARRDSRSRSNAPRGRGSPGPRHRGLGVLFWICLAFVVVAVAIAAREPLKSALSRLQGKPPAPAEPAAQPPRVTITPLSGTEKNPPAPAPSAPSADARPAAPPAPRQAPEERPAAVERPSARKVRLYFASVESDGRIVLKSVIRSIPSSDSPLRDTLETMLKGPTAQELNLGLVSMIPLEARLRSVAVKDDTAVIDFSEGFRFNSQGLDAMDAQVRQVVYAATEFPSVHRVQIRIEGQTVRYLDAEGMRLDQPLTRDSFRKQP